MSTNNIFSENKKTRIISTYKQKIESEGFYYFTKKDILELKRNGFPELNTSSDCIEIRKSMANCFTSDFKKASDFCIYTDRMKIEKISSLDEYIKKINNLYLAGDKTKFFRGQHNFAWSAIPSLFREKERIQEEHSLLMNMYRSKPEEFKDLNSFDIISKMQHYGLFTRLMDLTENPLVALYFACQGSSVDDGRVFIYNADTYRVRFSCEEEIIEAAKCILSNKNPKIENGGDLYAFVKADYSNTRISRQFGSFIFPLDNYKNKDISEIKEKFKKLNEIDQTIFLIDRSKKTKILEELRLFGVSDVTMLAGLDHISKSITEQNDLISLNNKLTSYLENKEVTSFSERDIKDLFGFSSEITNKVLENLENKKKIYKKDNCYTKIEGKDS